MLHLIYLKSFITSPPFFRIISKPHNIKCPSLSSLHLPFKIYTLPNLFWNTCINVSNVLYSFSTAPILFLFLFLLLYLLSDFSCFLFHHFLLLFLSLPFYIPAPFPYFPFSLSSVSSRFSIHVLVVKFLLWTSLFLRGSPNVYWIKTTEKTVMGHSPDVRSSPCGK